MKISAIKVLIKNAFYTSSSLTGTCKREFLNAGTRITMKPSLTTSLYRVALEWGSGGGGLGRLVRSGGSG